MPANPKPPEAPSAVPDVLSPGLDVVFCGINPGRVSASTGRHFANPRNDFWRLLHDAGFTQRLLDPAEQRELPALGYGLTNAAYRTTPGSGDLRRGDFEGSAARLARIADELEPRFIAFVGKEAYRGAFGERPELGLQERALGDTRLFVLPSTSPANAAVPYDERLRWFGELYSSFRLAFGVEAAGLTERLLVDRVDAALLRRLLELGLTRVGAGDGLADVLLGRGVGVVRLLQVLDREPLALLVAVLVGELRLLGVRRPRSLAAPVADTGVGAPAPGEQSGRDEDRCERFQHDGARIPPSGPSRASDW